MKIALKILSPLLLFVLFSARAGIVELEKYYRQAIEDWQVPGIAVAIVQDGQVLLAKGFGVRELGREEPVTEQTLFAIASNTKAFTAAAIAILAERKKLDWEDRVQQHLPWFQVFDDAWVSREARVDDLLCHRIGFRTFSGDLIWWNTPYSAGEIVKRARYLKPRFGFRDGYGYSNIMFIAAGEVVAHASGRSWEHFVREEILLPLGMTNTALRVEELKQRPDVATPHGNDDDGKPYTLEWQPWNSTSAAGGVISSAADLAKWLRLQLGEGKIGERKLWSKEQAWKMWSLHTPMPMSADSFEKNPELSLNGAGLGWFVSDYRGEFIARHGGAYDGMFSHTVMAPRKKIGIVVLSNSMTPLPHALAFQTLDHLLGKSQKDWSKERLEKERADRARKKAGEEKKAAARLQDTRPSLPLENYAGRYGGPMFGDATVELDAGKLVLKMIPNPELAGELVHWQHDVFEIHWFKKFAWFGKGKVQFLLDQESRVTEFKMDVPNEDFWFEELEFKKR